MGNRLGKSAYFGLVVSLVAVAGGCGPNDAPIQAAQRPHHLVVLESVKAAGSDWASWGFLWFDLPDLIALADREFSHAAFLDHFEQIKIDPARLRLTNESEVRVYFVGEGSGIPNALGLNLEGVGVGEGLPQILFPLVNTSVLLDEAARRARSLRFYAWGALGRRSEEAPILPGDFVDLGRLPAGTSLNFFLATPEHIFTPVPERNPDKIPHMVALAVEGTPYLLISFEDLPGGGEDYEDAVFAVEVSEGNVDALLGRFDPWRLFKRTARRAAWLALLIGTPLGIVLWRRRARVRRVRQTLDQAAQLISAGRHYDALALLDKADRVPAGAQKRRWRQLVYAAAEKGKDLAHLAELYEQAPALFLSNEKTALKLGRTQTETGRIESFETLRKAWRGREISKHSWVMLDIEALFKESRAPEALALLERSWFSKSYEPVRLARLACAKAHASRDDAAALVVKALEGKPIQAEAYFWAAMTWERLGRTANALENFRQAMKRAPRDPFIRERAADFCCRHGKLDSGLRLLREGLVPPSIDSLWTRFLFWTRVVHPMPAALDGRTPPPGPLQPLIQFMLGLPHECFWDERSFHRIAERSPSLESRPEVHWLRVLEALRLRQESHARWLLSFERSGWESWHPAFERALLRIVLFRQMESVGLLKNDELATEPVHETTHPFFQSLDELARNPVMMLSPQLDVFLRSDFIYSAACLAAGWKNAATRLHPPGHLPADAPDWARQLWKEAWKA